MLTAMAETRAVVSELVEAAVNQLKVLPSPRATLYYRATTREQDGALLVAHPDDDVPDGFVVAMAINACWSYDQARIQINKQAQALPILPGRMIWG